MIYRCGWRVVDSLSMANHMPYDWHRTRLLLQLYMGLGRQLVGLTLAHGIMQHDIKGLFGAAVR
jgi:hypothetical protein